MKITRNRNIRKNKKLKNTAKGLREDIIRRRRLEDDHIRDTANDVLDEIQEEKSAYRGLPQDVRRAARMAVREGRREELSELRRARRDELSGLRQLEKGQREAQRIIQRAEREHEKEEEIKKAIEVQNEQLKTDRVINLAQQAIEDSKKITNKGKGKYKKHLRKTKRKKRKPRKKRA